MRKKGLISEAVIIGLLVSLSIFLAFWAMSIGPAGIGWQEAFKALWTHFVPGSFAVSEMTSTVVVNIRAPRIIMANLAGFGLGMCGYAMQSVLKNPLASPYTLGLSAAAGFGAALAIVLGIGVLSAQYLIVGNAFVFSLLASMLVLGFASGRNARPESVILSGVAVMFLFSAGTTLLQFIADPYAVQAVVFWLIGDVGRASWDKIAVMVMVICLVTPYLLFKGWDIGILRMGDETAASLGVRVGLTRMGVMATCSLLTASVVAFVGAIGFIGLVAPHIVKLAGRGSEHFGLIASGMVGAILLASADMIALTVLAPNVLPIGVVTAFLGVPLFMFLIQRGKKSR